MGLIPFSIHVLDQLVQPIAAQFFKARGKATITVTNVADLKYN